MSPDSKNVNFIIILCCKNFTLKSGKFSWKWENLQCNFYNIGFGWKSHFWNQETLYSDARYFFMIGEALSYLQTHSKTTCIEECSCDVRASEKKSRKGWNWWKCKVVFVNIVKLNVFSHMSISSYWRERWRTEWMTPAPSSQSSTASWSDWRWGREKWGLTSKKPPRWGKAPYSGLLGEHRLDDTLLQGDHHWPIRLTTSFCWHINQRSVAV